MFPMGTRNLKIWKARYLNDITANHSAIRLLYSLTIVLAIAVIGLCMQVISLYLSDVQNHSKREKKNTCRNRVWFVPYVP